LIYSHRSYRNISRQLVLISLKNIDTHLYSFIFAIEFYLFRRQDMIFRDRMIRWFHFTQSEHFSLPAALLIIGRRRRHITDVIHDTPLSAHHFAIAILSTAGLLSRYTFIVINTVDTYFITVVASLPPFFKSYSYIRSRIYLSPALTPHFTIDASWRLMEWYTCSYYRSPAYWWH
jgi:hypothetical protein